MVASTKQVMLRDLSAPLLGRTTRLLDQAVEGLLHARRVTGFLRGRAEFQGRPSDVFISSYPRSGTTWTQWILHLLRGGAPEFVHINQVCPWFERSLAIGEFEARDLEAFSSPRVFKSHLPREWLPDGARYIYIERDGLDVLTSYYHFYRAYLRFEGTFAEFFDRFLEGRLQYGSWFKHVAGWRALEQEANLLIVRYEEMLSAPEAHVRKFADFLGWDVDESRIRAVLDASTFEEMKRREPQFDHATALALERGVVPKSFIRKGQSGDGNRSLSEDQMRLFERKRRSARPGRELRLPAFLR